MPWGNQRKGTIAEAGEIGGSEQSKYDYTIWHERIMEQTLKTAQASSHPYRRTLVVGFLTLFTIGVFMLGIALIIIMYFQASTFLAPNETFYSDPPVADTLARHLDYLSNDQGLVSSDLAEIAEMVRNDPDIQAVLSGSYTGKAP